MRIAVLILGLILGAAMFFQTFLVYALSGLSPRARATGESGAMGLVMAILWLVGVAAVLAAPLVSAIVFVIAGLIGFAMSANFPDLAIWGGVSLVLAAMSLIGWFTKRRDARKAEARHQELAAAASHVAPPVPSALPLNEPVIADSRAIGNPCPACRIRNPPGSRYCSNCGNALGEATSSPSVSNESRRV